MSGHIISLHDWFETPPGQYLLDWERAQYDEAVADLFGYHALQLGLPELDALAANRMPQRWTAVDTAAPEKADAAATARAPAFVTDFGALPFAENSLDLIALPHTLELADDPHATLREVVRVLMPEGRVVISGLNPTSLWGLREWRAQIYGHMGFGAPFLPTAGELIGYWRLRDWLRLLNFEVEAGNFGCYRPAVRSERWLGRFAWMDRAGDRWWPIFGAVYFLVAVKRVHGMRLLSAAWKPSRSAASAPVSIAHRAGGTAARHHKSHRTKRTDTRS
ncbi:MAG: FIG005121: SAM-dependent methyltransferase [Burkholderiaceae bacterium]|nr:MAG: FIG005121: SAM-dependent methyltransferase [Burkholderiaceae bacterium]